MCEGQRCHSSEFLSVFHAMSTWKILDPRSPLEKVQDSKKTRPVKTSYKMAVSCLGYDEDFKIQIYENNFQKKFKGQMKKSWKSYFLQVK